MAQERAVGGARARAGALQNQGLSAPQLVELYYKMALSRAIDERLWVLNRQGKVPFIVSGQGHEAAQVGSAYALRPGEDWVLPYYRDLGVAVTLGMTAREIMLDVFARADGPSSGGRQMPAHYSSRRLNIVTASSPVATQLPQATGVALASKYKGERAVTVCYFGDGATSKGDFHEALNFAAIHKLPVVFVCENNGYAISQPQSKEMPVAHVADRAAGYGMPGLVVDGNDALAVAEVAAAAVARARHGQGPTLIEAKTYRWYGHAINNPASALGRPEEEVRAWKEGRDPIRRLAEHALGRGLATAAELRALRAAAEQELEDAIAFAEASPAPAPEDALADVYAALPEGADL